MYVCSHWSPREVGVFTDVAPNLVHKSACQIEGGIWNGLDPWLHGRQPGVCAVHMADLLAQEPQSTAQAWPINAITWAN